MKCQNCGKSFHYCTSCGWDRDLHPLSQGFCSEVCLIECGGQTYDDVTREDEEVTS